MRRIVKRLGYWQLHLVEIFPPGSGETPLSSAIATVFNVSSPPRTEKQFQESEADKTDEQRRIDEQLQHSARLLGDLQKTQHERLSRPLPPHLALVPGPSDAEKELGAFSHQHVSYSIEPWPSKPSC